MWSWICLLLAGVLFNGGCHERNRPLTWNGNACASRCGLCEATTAWRQEWIHGIGTAKVKVAPHPFSLTVNFPQTSCKHHKPWFYLRLFHFFWYICHICWTYSWPLRVVQARGQRDEELQRAELLKQLELQSHEASAAQVAHQEPGEKVAHQWN